MVQSFLNIFVTPFQYSNLTDYGKQPIIERIYSMSTLYTLHMQAATWNLFAKWLGRLACSPAEAHQAVGFIKL